MLVRDHVVEDYAGLRDMDATDVGVLSEDDRACLAQLGEHLVTTDAWQRFAIWLLHKHFEPAPGEVFVERALRSPRKTETTPVDRSAFPGQRLSPTAVRFDAASDSAVNVVAMEFAEPADFGSSSPLSADDETALAGIAALLEANGKLDRFGVKLIRDPLGLSEGEFLLESCDSTERMLYCDASLRNAIPVDQTVVETTWRWKLVEGETTPIVMQDCTAGCISIGEGHDISHKHSQTDNDDNPIP
jgi:hypothetical protein